MLKVTLAQLNIKVGALKANRTAIVEAIEAAKKVGSHLVVFPELTVCGYPPEDLLYHQQFIEDCLNSLHEIAKATDGIAVVLGFPRFEQQLFNSAAFIQDGQIRLVYDKQKLPNYLVFDEKRYFSVGSNDGIIETTLNGQKLRLGITVCEDIWYAAEPVMYQIDANVDMLINISASPYAQGKIDERISMLQGRSKKSGKPLIFCNLVGGQDELIFDGTSCIFNKKAELIHQSKSFHQDIQTIDLEATQHKHQSIELLDEIQQAIVRGTRDYFYKNGFKKAVLGLSGGIDSALCAALAVEALGADHVTGLLMPSKYSSDHSIADAQELADNLSIEHHILEIEPKHQAYANTLKKVLDDYYRNLTDENLQARIRGMLLMAWSNNHNALVLATGNKSEIAVGYCTLYGDMCGAYAPIKDLFKNQVYALAHHMNRDGILIPENTLIKPPSAELRPEQLDSDSLPDYDHLDEILTAYVHEFKDAEEIAALGFDIQLVRRILRLVDINEYKRQQAAPGPRLTKMAFGKDRRMPMTNGYSS
ncbi:NAD+ synthase [Marinicella sp. W31]|uniref:NAD+ synthase n=1 Tax=Marinicella sp. W31 TaxID=3023713 RepID=UPI0037571C1E